MTRPGRTPLFSRRLSVLVIAGLILLDLLLASRASHLQPPPEAVAPAAAAPEAEKPCSPQPQGPWLP